MQVSIIVPVYKERSTIIQTLATLAGVFNAIPHEILVVDGDPSSSTLSVLPPMALSGKGIRLLTSSQGRGPQMNAGAKAATGDIFFFVHADSRPDPKGIQDMVAAFMASDPDRFCGAFDLCIDSEKKIFRVIEKTASLRSRLTRRPYGDQGIFISRTLFNAVGGFPDQPLMEDVGLMSAVKRSGARPVFLNSKMTTSARRWENRGILKTTLSNWVFISLYILGVPPEKLALWYYS